MTVRSAVVAVASDLAAAGISPARAEAELLTAHVLGIERGRLFLASDPTETQLAELSSLAGERASGTPLQHLLGSAPFRHLDLAVGPGVFIPRPETELLIDIAEPVLRHAARVVDLCAGSGAIALAVATEFGGAEVYAVERSAQALAWLHRNVARIAAGVTVLPGDVADAELLAAHQGQVDVVLSNPPYVPLTQAAALAVEVHHDPVEAVFAGPDGLAVLAPVIGAAARLLRPGGLVVLEHDDCHQPAVLELFAAAGLWVQVRAHRDLTGRPRFVSAVRAEAAGAEAAARGGAAVGQDGRHE